jgi:DNA repair photolyase
MGEKRSIRGRGAVDNPPNRFEPLVVELEPGVEQPRPATQFLRDTSRTVLVRNESPDVGFDVSINPYRGCEHGCVYCYARPTHEYLGFSAGLDFETKILVKEDAPEQLERELSSPRWTPEVIALSGNTDSYQPVERHLQLTRRCLEVLARFRNPVAIVTKNHLVTRDVDLLGELAHHEACSVSVSVTTLDADLAATMEPRTSHPERRLLAVERLGRAGIPAGVMVAPVIPALNDHEIPAIVERAAAAGAAWASYLLLRLPHNLKLQFSDWLELHHPQRRTKILNRIRSMRDGKLNSTQFGTRMRGTGIHAEQIHDLFQVACRRVGLPTHPPSLSTAAFRRPGGSQMSLF